MNFVELQIRKKVIAELPPGDAPYEFAGTLYPPDTLTTPADVRSRLPQAPGVVLVTMDECEGGGVDAGMAVYEALRDFSLAGGTVVVHVGRMAASTASVIALAGDVILMAPEARYILHSTLVRGGVSGDEANHLRDKVNAHLLAVYEARGWIPRAALEDALAHEYDPARDVFRCVEVNAETAVQLGWADGVGSIEKARAAAALIASGLPVTSTRIDWLRGRPEPKWPGCSALVSGSIQAHHLDVDEINASGKITARAIQTLGYAEDASGNPTVGAKLDAQGTALKVAPGNLQVGDRALSFLTSTAAMTVGPGWSLTINRVTRSFGVVGIHLNGTVQDQSSASWYAIGTIPAEYRPTHPTDNVSLIGRVLDSSTGSSYVANFNIHPDGTVALFRYGNPLAMPFTIGNGDVVNLYGSFVRD